MALKDTIEMLVDPDLMKCIPSFLRGHALSGAAKLIAREYPELAGKAETGTLSATETEQLRSVVSGIYQERMKKRNI